MSSLFFALFVVAVLTCGSILVGPFSIRVYCTVFMMLYLLLFVRIKKRKELKIDRTYIYIYLIFISYMFFALLINGGGERFDYFHFVLAFYLVGIVAFFSVDSFVNNSKEINRLIFVISLIILVDAVISFLQYQNNTTGWIVGMIFGDVSEQMDYIDRHNGVGMDISLIAGIFGGPVNNAFCLATCAPLFMARITSVDNIKTPIKIYYILIVIMTVVSCFFIQQRAAFYLLLFVILYYLFKALVHRKTRIISVIVVLLLIIFLISLDFSSVDLGRLSSSRNDDRNQLMKSTSATISQYFLFGNPVEYYKREDLSAHNVILDSLVTAGVFAALIMSVLYLKTIIKSLRLIFNNKKGSEYTKAFAISVLIAMIIGLFHNTSYFTGHVLIFIVLALMLKSERLDNTPILEDYSIS